MAAPTDLRQQDVRDGRLRTNIGTLASLDDAVAAFTSKGAARGEGAVDQGNI
ncbi:MAG TPA: hypothetical protein VHN55_06010 [Sphingomicrobium sp.]|nr:hypothetical protein [Sphingomicrobium sp.]